jgi:hypothetical protein
MTELRARATVFRARLERMRERLEPDEEVRALLHVIAELLQIYGAPDRYADLDTVTRADVDTRFASVERLFREWREGRRSSHPGET